MSSTNVLLCCRRVFVNIFKSPVLHYKRHVIVSFNRNALDCSVQQSRLFSNPVRQERSIEKESNDKAENEKGTSYNRDFKYYSKDLQLPDDHDPDVFGTLDKNFVIERKLEEMPEEEGDVEETIYYNEKKMRRGRLTINKYGKIIKHFLEKKKLGNAIDVLETRMLKEDKVAPDRYIYNLLISGCAQRGYTKKAFQLFNQMKKRGLEPSASTYTSLFNACSSSPWADDGLKRLKKLRELLFEKGIMLNQKNYHAMIKAYGRCNDLESAFNVVDEMIEKQILVTNETFNFLLQSCITDNEAGLRHAILVWNKMMSKGLKPDLYSFNLILRCTRDCGLGSLEATSDVIQTVLASSKRENSGLLESHTSNKSLNSAGGTQNVQLVTSYDEKSVDSVLSSSNNDDNLIENRPNLLSKNPHLGDIIGLTDIKLPEHRLLLLGGCEGFLREMKSYNIKPNIKTFSQLLETIPSTLAAEKSLLNSLKEFKVEPDIDFFNILIKKRSMRYDYKNAREVLKLVQEHLLTPDIVTFGVLALSCLTLEEAEQLIRDMDEFGYRMNIEILGALLRNAVVSWDIEYIVKVMRLVLDENITPSPTFIGYLMQFYSSVKKYQEMSKNKETSNLSKDGERFIEKVRDEEFMKQFREYCKFYQKWKYKALPEEPPHPYAQFQKHDDPEDVAIMNTGRSSK